MANRPITITGIANGELVLSDNGNTFVNAWDTVTWKIGTDSGVASITGILDDSTIDVFSPDPTQKQNSSSWEMEFVAVIGARMGDTFLPVKSVVWRLEDEHTLDSSGILSPTKTEAKAEAPQEGAPDDLAIEQAMAGPTCRFVVRSISDYCRPELA